MGRKKSSKVRKAFAALGEAMVASAEQQRRVTEKSDLLRVKAQRLGGYVTAEDYYLRSAAEALVREEDMQQRVADMDALFKKAGDKSEARINRLLSENENLSEEVDVLTRDLRDLREQIAGISPNLQQLVEFKPVEKPRKPLELVVNVKNLDRLDEWGRLNRWDDTLRDAILQDVEDGLHRIGGSAVAIVDPEGTYSFSEVVPF